MLLALIPPVPIFYMSECFINHLLVLTFIGLNFCLADEGACCGSKADGGAKLAVWTCTSNILTPALAAAEMPGPSLSTSRRRCAQRQSARREHAAVTASDIGRRKLQRYGVSAAAPPHPNEKSRPLLLLVQVACPL